MAPVSIKFVVSFSSQDEQHPVSNLTSGDGFRKWLSNPSDRSGQIEAVFQLDKPAIISYIDVGSIWCATLELQVGRSDWPQTRPLQTLVYTVSLMTPPECRAGQGHSAVRMRMFSAADFATDVASKEWDRLKIICRQPYRKDVQYGLSFIRVKSNSPGTPGNKIDASAGSVATIQEHFFKEQASSNSPKDGLKSKLLKIAGSAENGTEHHGSLSRTARLVLAASGAKTNTYSAKDKADESKGLYSSHVEQKYGPKFSDEAQEFLKSLNIRENELDKITIADLRHKFEKKKVRKLTTEEKKEFLILARAHIQKLFGGNEKEDNSKPKGDKVDTRETCDSSGKNLKTNKFSGPSWKTNMKAATPTIANRPIGNDKAGNQTNGNTPTSLPASNTGSLKNQPISKADSSVVTPKQPIRRKLITPYVSSSNKRARLDDWSPVSPLSSPVSSKLPVSSNLPSESSKENKFAQKIQITGERTLQTPSSPFQSNQNIYNTTDISGVQKLPVDIKKPVWNSPVTSPVQDVSKISPNLMKCFDEFQTNRIAACNDTASARGRGAARRGGRQRKGPAVLNDFVCDGYDFGVMGSTGSSPGSGRGRGRGGRGKRGRGRGKATVDSSPCPDGIDVDFSYIEESPKPQRGRGRGSRGGQSSRGTPRGGRGKGRKNSSVKTDEIVPTSFQKCDSCNDFFASEYMANHTPRCSGRNRVSSDGKHTSYSTPGSGWLSTVNTGETTPISISANSYCSSASNQCKNKTDDSWSKSGKFEDMQQKKSDQSQFHKEKDFGNFTSPKAENDSSFSPGSKPWLLAAEKRLSQSLETKTSTVQITYTQTSTFTVAYAGALSPSNNKASSPSYNKGSPGEYLFGKERSDSFYNGPNNTENSSFSAPKTQTYYDLSGPCGTNQSGAVSNRKLSLSNTVLIESSDSESDDSEIDRGDNYRECPICGDHFPLYFIELHASSCYG